MSNGLRTYPGADVDNDHNPVINKIKIKLKATKVKKAKDYTILKDERSKTHFVVSIRNKYESLLVEKLEQEQEPEYEIEKPEKLWEVLKKSLHYARDEVILKKEKKNSKTMDGQLMTT